MKAALAANLVVTVLVLATLLHFALAEAAPIIIKTWPKAFAFAPCDVTVHIRVVPVHSDRVIGVEMAGDDFYRYSAWTLNGADAPRLHVVTWRDVPAGTYTLRASIGDGSRARGSAVAQLSLLSR